MNARAILALMLGVCRFAAQAGHAQPQTRASVGDGPSPVSFRPVVVCDPFVGGYQVALADVNGDRRPDILALGEHPGTVDWFENPGSANAPWPRHPISHTVTRRSIDLAVYDVDGDGHPEVAIAAEFELGRSGQGGTVSWLHRRSDDAQEWAAIRIHAEPTAHRVRWADLDGDRRKELITVPIVGPGAKPPKFQESAARLMCHWIPRDPARDAWPEQVFDQSLTVAHGVFVTDWDGDGRDEILTASNQGVHLFKADGAGTTPRWSRKQLTAVRPGEPPNCGASEVCVGRTESGTRFLVTIEPWHGNEVVIYTPPPDSAAPQELWPRQVIDDTLRAGHALCCVDLDGDGADEIVAGYRGEGTSLYGYRRIAGPPSRWERFVIDAGGIAAQGCVPADMNGDGRIDLVATGGTTHNVKLYINEPKPSSP